MGKTPKDTHSGSATFLSELSLKVIQHPYGAKRNLLSY